MMPDLMMTNERWGDNKIILRWHKYQAVILCPEKEEMDSSDDDKPKDDKN